MQQLRLTDTKTPHLESKRTWLKFKVSNGRELSEVRAILELWAKSRSTPRKLFGAIRLFHALDTGDLDCFQQLLAEYFPVLKKFMGGAIPMLSYPILPASHQSDEEITFVAMSAEDIATAALNALDELL